MNLWEICHNFGLLQVLEVGDQNPRYKSSSLHGVLDLLSWLRLKQTYQWFYRFSTFSKGQWSHWHPNTSTCDHTLLAFGEIGKGPCPSCDFKFFRSLWNEGNDDDEPTHSCHTSSISGEARPPKNNKTTLNCLHMATRLHIMQYLNPSESFWQITY